MDDDEHLEKLVEEEFGKFNYHKIMREVFDSIELKDDNPNLRKKFTLLLMLV
ncbi:MAG: hypothetical protein FWH54_00080 [Methanobrevibacter sp.]|nr:hypothetical protein [Methanobrevibacter sp.]